MLVLLEEIIKKRCLIFQDCEEGGGKAAMSQERRTVKKTQIKRV